MTRNSQDISHFDRRIRPAASEPQHPELAKKDAFAYISPYDRRVRLVADTLMRHSEVDETTAVDLAGHVLFAIDRVPEKVR